MVCTAESQVPEFLSSLRETWESEKDPDTGLHPDGPFRAIAWKALWNTLTKAAQRQKLGAESIRNLKVISMLHDRRPKFCGNKFEVLATKLWTPLGRDTGSLPPRTLGSVLSPVPTSTVEACDGVSEAICVGDIGMAPMPGCCS